MTREVSREAKVKSNLIGVAQHQVHFAPSFLYRSGENSAGNKNIR